MKPVKATVIVVATLAVFGMVLFVFWIRLARLENEAARDRDRWKLEQKAEEARRQQLEETVRELREQRDRASNPETAVDKDSPGYAEAEAAAKRVYEELLKQQGQK